MTGPVDAGLLDITPDVSALVRIVFLLAPLVGLAALGLWHLRRKRRVPRRIRVEERILLGRGMSLVLLAADGRSLLVGLSSDGMRLIHAWDAAAGVAETIDDDEAERGELDFAQILSRVLPGGTR